MVWQASKAIAGLKSFQMRGLNAIACKERTTIQSITIYARGKHRPVQRHTVNHILRFFFNIALNRKIYILSIPSQ